MRLTQHGVFSTLTREQIRAAQKRFLFEEVVGTTSSKQFVVTDVQGPGVEKQPGGVMDIPNELEPYDLIGTFKHRPRCRAVLLQRQFLVYAGPPVRGQSTWGGEFDLVVSVAPGEDWYETPEGTERMHRPFEDGEAPDEALLDGITDRITEALSANQRVAVHCQMGLNRAPFVAALTARSYLGLSGPEALWYVRMNHERPRQALSNERFCEVLCS